MKKALKIGAIVIGGLLIVFFGVALFLPSEYEVTRSETIAVPPEQLFDLIDDLERLVEWSPWKAVDPTMEYTFSDPPAGVGAWYTWISEDTGSGKMTVVESVRPRTVRAELEFEGGKMSATNRFTLEPEPDGKGTRVFWTIEGDDGGHLAHRWFIGLMDSMIGPWCVDGLGRLKKLAESLPPPPTPPSPPEAPEPAEPELE